MLTISTGAGFLPSTVSPLAFSLLHVTHLMSVDAQLIFDMFPYFWAVSTTLPRNQQPARKAKSMVTVQMKLPLGIPYVQGQTVSFRVG